MLRLSRERLLVSLEPAAVCWVRLRGAWRPRIDGKRSVEADPAFGQEPWQGALAALRGEAESLRAAPLDVTVVLSNHFVRYALVPAPQGAANEAEELALARFQFAKIHGERARSWEVRLAPERFGAARLACALDAGLTESLKACFPKGAKPRLVSVQPYLMSAFNHWRARVPEQGAWLLLVEPEHACLGLRAGGAWQAVQNHRGAFTTPGDWTLLVEREKHRTNLDPVPGTLLVRCGSRIFGGSRSEELPNMLGLGVAPLPGFVPIEDDRYVMALTAQ